jgi:two-component sensor histidine kinase
MILWFRAEKVEEVEWAGNPHKQNPTPGGVLSPRASFDAWREDVHGRSRRWTLPEIEAAGRLRPAVLNVRQNRRIRELNVRLTETLNDKDALLQQKEFLIGEVNHRVQNSLQLVSSFLALQARDADDGFKATVEEARRRLNAVALVHRRLYRGDHLELVDAARYLDELVGDAISAMGPEWAEGLSLDLAPISLPTDRAVTVGLILTELMINANKYAYDGAAGPLQIRLIEDRDKLRLVVADHGKGKVGTRKGFGSRLMDALVGQLGGELTYEDNAPGLRAVLTAPAAAPK